jgi:hypothetical protein
MDRAMATKIHYAGALEWTRANGSLVIVLPGGAACCSGPKARNIAEMGNHTYDWAAVTCGRCRACILAASTKAH